MAESKDPKAAAQDLDKKVEEKIRELNKSDAYSVITDTYTKMTGVKNAQNINRAIDVFENAGSFSKLEKILQSNSENTFRNEEINALNTQMNRLHEDQKQHKQEINDEILLKN